MKMKYLKKFNESNENKIPFEKWVDKFFDKDRDHNYWTSRYEMEVIGFAPSDLSRYREDDLEGKYQQYINDDFEDEEESDFYNEI